MKSEPKKFGELSEYGQMSLFQSWLRGKAIQAYSPFLDEWGTATHPYWARGAAYRIKPIELTKPSINWSHVHEDYMWMATDEDGDSFIFIERPKLGGISWVAPMSEWNTIDCFTSYKAGTCNWKDSLVERPHE